MDLNVKEYPFNYHEVAKELRKRIINTSSKAKIPHLGSCLSCVDLLVFLYWSVLDIDPQNPSDLNRDRFILSKGHGAPALFQVLAEKGFFPIKKLEEFGLLKCFHEHPPKPSFIRVEAATGSLGHGLPIALGMALAAKIQRKNFKCFALLSDGECNEGSIWEAAMLAPTLGLSNLTVIIDFNKWQATGRSKEIMNLEPLDKKWDSFGWNVQEVDGHDFKDIKNVFLGLKDSKKPNAIIAHTVKGKGVSFMEDDNNWHYRMPNQKELELALKEL